MAVTLTVEALRNALRTGDTTEETTEITRLLGYSAAVVDSHVGSAVVPNEIENEAAIRVAAYLYDMPAAARGSAYANVFRNSGAAAMLLPFRTHRAGGIEVTDADAATPSPDSYAGRGISSAYQFLALPVLTVPDAVTSSDSPVAIADTGLGAAYALLTPTSFEGPIEPENPFWTVWTGGVHLRIDAAGTLHARMRTVHSFAGKAFTHVREHLVDVSANTSVDLPLNVFNSRSVVSLGSYTAPDGTKVDITQADVDGASSIAYTLEFTLTNRRSDVRKAGNLTEVGWERPQTSSYQLSLGTSNISAATPALSLIRNQLNQLNAQVEALEKQDALTPAQLASLARIPNPALPSPASGTRGQFLKQAAAGETYVFDPTPDAATLARIPNPALPSPASGTRGHFLKQSDSGETYVFDQAQGVVDQTARETADDAERDAQGALAGLQIVTDELDSLSLNTETSNKWTNTNTNHNQVGFDGISNDERATGAQFGTNTNSFTFTDAGNFTPVIWIPYGDYPEVYRVQQVRGGSVVATYAGDGQYWRRYASSDDERLFHLHPYFLASGSNDNPDAVAVQEGDIFRLQKDTVTASLRIPLSALGAAVAKRLLPEPTAGNKGKFTAIKNDGSAWEVVDPPKAGGPPTSYTTIVSSPTKDAMGAWNLSGANAQAGPEATAVFNAYVSGSYRWIAFVNISSNEIEYHVVIPVMPATAAGLAIGTGRTVEHSYVSNASPSNDQHALSGYFRIANNSGTKNAFLTVNRLGSGGVLGFNSIIGIP